MSLRRERAAVCIVRQPLKLALDQGLLGAVDLSASTQFDLKSLPMGHRPSAIAAGGGHAVFAHEKSTKAPEGAVAGAGAGGAVGGTLGLLAGMGALAIPGLGPVHRRRPHHGGAGRRGRGRHGGRAHRRAGRHGHPRGRGQAVRGQGQGRDILISIHVTNGTDLAHAKRVLENHGATHIVTMGEKKAA